MEYNQSAKCFKYQNTKVLCQLSAELRDDVSHKIRTPLTVIKGFVELFLDSKNFEIIPLEDLQIVFNNILRLEKAAGEIDESIGVFTDKISYILSKFNNDL